MNSEAYTKSEYYWYAAGSVVLGGLILAPLISFYISRFVPLEFPPPFSQILFASSILSILHAGSIDRVSGEFNFTYFFKMLIFFNLMALAAYFGGDGRKSAVLLVPGVLVIVVYWVCGEFALALTRTLKTGDKDSERADVQRKLKHFGAGVGLLVGFVVVSSFFVDAEQFFSSDSKPVLVRVSFANDLPRREVLSLYQRMERQAAGMKEVSAVNTRMGKAPNQQADIARLYSTEFLIEISLHEEWQTRTAKSALSEKLLKLFEHPVALSRLVTTIEPLIPAQSSSPAKELRFRLDHGVVSKLNINEAYVSEEVASMLRLAPSDVRFNDLMDLKILTQDGNAIPIRAIGDFEQVEVKVDSAMLLPGSWQPLPLTNDRSSGYLIEVSLGRLYQYGLTISEVERKVNSFIDALPGGLDEHSLSDITLIQDAESSLRLGDIARVDQIFMPESPKGVGGKGYRIQWSY
jgi:hypothetical protein